jgi:glycerol-1-phosphate dehydrogenase [NAD(P)+]
MDLDSISKRLQKHLQSASDTKAVKIGSGVIGDVVDVFRECFGNQRAVIVADCNTYAAAGRLVKKYFCEKDHALQDLFLFEEDHVAAHYETVERLVASFSQHDAIPIAVGSGAINDVTKLAAYETGRSYMSVATAASMDGYTAFGASITRSGSKQTFYCPAPTAFLADIDIICAAPPEMNAAGYADLIAKVTAGADWIVADALGAESIDERAWQLVQPSLRDWISNPVAVREGQPEAISSLIEGLVMAGLGMQASKSSRPASGAEHQFSHLWDMQGHTFNGSSPSHGFKVGIGMLAAAVLYEKLLSVDGAALNPKRISENWPTLESLIESAREKHELPEMADMAEEEVRAKYISKEEVFSRFSRLEKIWPELKQKLAAQLIPAITLREMLLAVGAPAYAEEIGISLPRLRHSYFAAQTIRRRYTILDIAFEAGLLDVLVEESFSAEGFWSTTADPAMSVR